MVMSVFKDFTEDKGLQKDPFGSQVMFRAFKRINNDSYVYLRQSDNVIVYLIEAFTEFPEILQFPAGLVHDDFNGTLDLSFKHATQCNKKESY
jgi:hypothetical protein